MYCSRNTQIVSECLVCDCAFVALIACLLNVSIPIQVAIFLVVSVICAIVARTMAVKSLKGNIIHTNNDALIGTHALVKENRCRSYG